MTGTSPIATLLRRDADRVQLELTEAGRRAGNIFINTCDITYPAYIIETKSSGNNPIVDLKRIMLEKTIHHTHTKDELS